MIKEEQTARQVWAYNLVGCSCEYLHKSYAYLRYVTSKIYLINI